MPMLDFKGKQFVYAHHLSVPFRTLEIDAKKSLPPPGSKPVLDDNLIIHGDNLHALKALLPTYAGKVDCVFIDPPYNTGNEGWCYNDNVRSPLMQEWIKDAANPVDNEDLERHDKWCCMMWPRLKLLSEDGVLFVTIDDNEEHQLRCLLDEVFGRHNFVATIIWEKKYSTKSDSKYLSESHDFLLFYAKDIGRVTVTGLQRSAEQEATYKNPDNDPRGAWASDNLLRTEVRDYAIFEIEGPTGKKHLPPKGSSWRFTRERIAELEKENRLWFGANGTSRPRLKRFLSEVRDTVPPRTIWTFSDVGSSDSAKKHLGNIMHEETDYFPTPKPVPLVQRALAIAAKSDALVLDSFAGSATTAEAVLALNAKDSGDRRFILVECENYADTLTAERVRRVVNGYSFEGTQREELYRRKLNFTALKKAGEILGSIEGIENLEGHRFDKISKTVKNDELIVTGEKKVTEKTEGLGGSFTYCTLGEEINLQTLLSGDKLPAYNALAKYVFYTATGQTLPKVPKPGKVWFIGETTLYRVHLLYKPEKKWLRSNASALTQELVDAIAKRATPQASQAGGRADPSKKTLVFASTKFMGQKDLTRQHIEFCQLPYAIYRVLGD